MDKETNREYRCFSAADLLLPREEFLRRWAVIACDQFTSEPEYWKAVEETVGNSPSSLRLILPESELNGDTKQRIESIHESMLQYLQGQVFREYPDSYIYTERHLSGGLLRCGVIGKIDLEAYDFGDNADAEILATEKTVTERIPPRMTVRRGAALELPHILLLCDDERCRVIEPFHSLKAGLPKLYDFDLMLGGGRVTGWLVRGKEKQALEERLSEYERRERAKHPGKRLIYAVGDGNHSLATAKACLEEAKAQNPQIDYRRHPARYALCELNNIHDPNQVFEPIHRIVKNCNPEELLADLRRSFDGSAGAEITWLSGEHSGRFSVPNRAALPIAILQQWLDQWLSAHDGDLDYIHGLDALELLGRRENTVAFRLPPVEKGNLFRSILNEGVLPRKTFSMGEARDKRYYLEARRILPDN